MELFGRTSFLLAFIRGGKRSAAVAAAPLTMSLEQRYQILCELDADFPKGGEYRRDSLRLFLC